MQSNRVVVFYLLKLAGIEESGHVEWSCQKGFVNGVLVIMSKFHSSCWEAAVYEFKIEAFIDFGKVVNDVKVVIPDYDVKCCGIPFVFGNNRFPCDLFI